MSVKTLRVVRSLLILFAFAASAHAQAQGLKMKVTKQAAPGKAGDKTETIHLRVEIENTGQVAYKDLRVSWFIVVDKEPDKVGLPPKKNCVSGDKIVSLMPKDTTSFESTQVSVSKTGQGFYWDPKKPHTDAWNWNPKYHGYGIQIVGAGKIIYADYQPDGMKSAVQQYEAEQAAAAQKK